MFESLSLFFHNVMSIRESQPPGKTIKEAERVDPFGGAKPHPWKWSNEVPLRVNPEQPLAFRPGSSKGKSKG
jgi:hypothetical protein